MIPVHCKPVTQTGRETGSYISCQSLSWQKFSAQDRMAEVGMKEKLFWLNLRCIGKTGQVWRKWDFRKLAGITKSQGTAFLSPGLKFIRICLCDWLISLNMMSMRFIHDVAKCQNFFYFLGWIYFVVCTTFIHAAINGHLGCSIFRTPHSYEYNLLK